MTNSGQLLESDVENERPENLSAPVQAKGRMRANAARKSRIEAGLPAYRTPIEVARDKPTSKRNAIYAKCYECQGGGADPGWQWAIGNCEITECPLHSHRSYQRKEGQPPEGVYR